MRRLTAATGKGVDEETAGDAADQADDGGDGDGRRGLAERDTADEDDRLHALTQYSNEREDEQHPLAALCARIDVCRRVIRLDTAATRRVARLCPNADAGVPDEVWRLEHRLQIRDGPALVRRDAPEELVCARVV